TEKCVRGIVANEERCRELVELSMAMVTSLSPKIGYDRAAEIAKESAKTGRTVREIAREKKILPEDELERALDPIKMTEPGGTGGGGSVRGCHTRRAAVFRRRKYRNQVPEPHVRANGCLLSRHVSVTLDRGRKGRLHFSIW